MNQDEHPRDGPSVDSPITRRDFARLSAATFGATLALPDNATSSVTSAEMTARYEYVLNHTPVDYAVPTLVRFSDASGPDAMDDLLDVEVLTTTEPEPAAYAQLTAAQAADVSDLPTAETLSHSPGSNPFWRIGYYPLGVFPEPRRSVDFVGFEQLKDGLRELEERYPDRVRVKNVGESPGHHNNLTDRPDPKGMYVVELTNFESETDFADKEKVFFSCSLHGLERAGAETGARVVENVTRGSEPDIQGSDEKIERYLDDVVVLMGFTNPDGWAVRNPQYDSGWQTGGPGTDLPRAPAAPVYERGNAEVYDTNRQYPVVGMIDPAHYPAHPDDGVGDPPTFVSEKVPDAAAFVDFFSGYESLNYGADLHGGPVFNEFVLGLISQDQFDTRQLHELYEMCLSIDETLEEALEVWTTAGDIRTELLGDDQYDPLLWGVTPTEAFDYSTIFDTIDYTVTGAFLDWMAHPEPIGLDLTTLDFEMSFSHMTGGNVYNPELLEMEVKGYRTAIRTITAFAVRNSDTPTTDDQFAAHTESGGESVAYVTTGAVGTDEDALLATDDDLVFEDDSGGDGGDGDGATLTTEEVTLSADTTELTFEVGESDLHSMGFQVRAGSAVADVELLAPDGELVGEFEAVTEERAGGKCCDLPEISVPEPAAGEWTVRVHNRRDVEQRAEFAWWTLAASGTNPDPTTAWDGEGFEQREYGVTPFRFFEDYAEFIGDGGTMEPVTVEEVAGGALVDYDHAVVIHDYGANADADYLGETTGYSTADHPTGGYDVDGYVEALDDFVDDGGNLVLTDAGVNLVTELDNHLVNGDRIGRGDVAVSEFIVARFEAGDEEAKNLGHPLFGTEDDVRPIQNQLWKVQPLGYLPGRYDSNGQAPMYLPAEDALAAAGENATVTVAGRAENQAEDRDGSGIAAASLTPDDSTGRGVHLVASLLPPGTQTNLHPFGLQNYTVTFLGYVLFTSALGWEQVREAGDTTRRYGRGDQWDTSDVEHLDAPGSGFSASGSRDDDGSTFTGGQTNRVAVTVEPSGADADEVRDAVPDEWELWDDQPDGVEARTVDGTTYAVYTGPAPEGEQTDFHYYARAPEGTEHTGEYEFGPGEAVATVDGETVVDTFAGTETNAVVGASTDAD